MMKLFQALPVTAVLLTIVGTMTSCTQESTPNDAARPSLPAAVADSSTTRQPAEPVPPPRTELPVPSASSTQTIATAIVPADVQITREWTQWGGSPKRNNTPVGVGIPHQWNPGEFNDDQWMPETAENVKWVAALGSQTYGNAVVAGKKVFVGTNNSAGWVKRYPADVDLGCLLAFDSEDGKFLWQHSSEKLPTGRVHDWPLQGICCAPLVEDKRLWFVSSRGEVLCLDTEGFHDGTDNGPVQNQWGRVFDWNQAKNAEKHAAAIESLGLGQLTDALRALFQERGLDLSEEVTIDKGDADKSWTMAARVGGTDRKFRLEVRGPNLSAFKLITADDKDEADVIWSLNMMKELGVSQHNMCSCSVTASGEVLFVNTSNGVEEFHNFIPAPEAPSFIAVDKNTGKVLWTDNSPGTNILHGQWSSPAIADLGGVPQVIFGGGDGWVYSFHADGDGNGNSKLLWKFDANPKESKWILGGRGTRNNIIATPVIHEDLVYVAVGQDPEHAEGPGHLWCIDPTKKLDGSDVSPQQVFRVDNDEEPIPHRRIQACDPEKHEVARDNPNSAAVWHYHKYDQNDDGEFDWEEEMHRSCGTVAIQNDLLYIADFSGLFHCLNAKTGEVYWTHDMLASAWGSPLIVEGKVYIGDEDGDVTVFKLSEEKEILSRDEDGEPGPINMGNSVFSTAVVADNVLYITNKKHLFAIATDK